MSTIESVSHESRMFEAPPAFAAQTNVDKAAYDRLNAAAAADYAGFWAKLARSIAKGEPITQDVSTLENPAILEQLKQVL